MRQMLRLAALTTCIAVAGGCSEWHTDADYSAPSAYGSPGSSGMGATQGGVQDMSFARELVEQGGVHVEAHAEGDAEQRCVGVLVLAVRQRAFAQVDDGAFG